MFVLGHVATVAAARVLADHDVLAGEGAVELLLPDMVACHEWGYEDMWGLRDSHGLDFAPAVAHIIGDAAVHFGKNWDQARPKRGWVYQRMHLAFASYDEFFTFVEGAGLRDPSIERDSRRGFCHTMVEYSIDQYLADSGRFDATYEAYRTTFSDGRAVVARADRAVQALAIRPGRRHPWQAQNYANVLAAAEGPDEFHIRGLAEKMQVEATPEVIDWIRGRLRSIVAEIDDAEFDALLTMLTDVLDEAVESGYPTTELPWEL